MVSQLYYGLPIAQTIGKGKNEAPPVPFGSTCRRAQNGISINGGQDEDNNDNIMKMATPNGIANGSEIER